MNQIIKYHRRYFWNALVTATSDGGTFSIIPPVNAKKFKVKRIVTEAYATDFAGTVKYSVNTSTDKVSTLVQAHDKSNSGGTGVDFGLPPENEVVPHGVGSRSAGNQIPYGVYTPEEMTFAKELMIDWAIFNNAGANIYYDIDFTIDIEVVL